MLKINFKALTMRYVITIALLTLISVLQASTHYPSIFSNQGTPLYKSAQNIEKFKKFEALKVQTSQYVQKLNRTKEIGFKADVSDEKKDKIEYLKSLRNLQESHDAILQHSIKELNSYIAKNDYRNFLKMVNVGMSHYQEKAILEKKIFSYYKQNRSKGESKTLNKIIKEKKSVTTRYFTSNEYVAPTKTSVRKKSFSQEIILLSRPGCSFCAKTKKYLKDKGSQYEEYNINSGIGADLFRQNNGSGVPMLLVEGKVIRGFNPTAMNAALK